MAQCLQFYTWCSSLGVNCYLYTNPQRTIPVSIGWVSDGTTNWTVNSSGMITGQANCVYEYYSYRVAGNSNSSVIITWRNCSDILQVVTLPNPGQFEYIIDCAMEGTVETSVYLGLNSITKSVYTVADRNNPTQCSSYYHPSSQTAYVMIWKNCSGQIQTQSFSSYVNEFNFCAQGSAVFQFSPSVTRTANSCPPYGTFINTTCVGNDLYNVYADGNGGTYSTFSQFCATECECSCNFYQMNDSGYVSFLDCSGVSQYQYYEWYDGFCAITLFSGNANTSQTCLY